jgi:phosphoribosylglycinamide formyltransferase-1
MAAIHQHIQSGTLDASIAIVISNKADAKGLDFAKQHGIKTAVVERPNFESKEDYETAIGDLLVEHNVELVVLAGYMRVLGDGFIHRFENKIVNIHPSLLPAFKGLDAQKQALDYGVKIAGCSVHFVDTTLDGGPIIMQEAVNVLENDTEESLSARILEKEHALYSRAIQWVIETKLPKWRTT